MLNQRNCNILTAVLFLFMITSASMGILWLMDNFNKAHIRNLETESFNFNIKVSATYNDIVIDDLPGSLTNWTWAETQIWFGGGSGTIGSPYIIESHTFEYSAGGGDSFAILNSRKYFIIRNCTFVNSNSIDVGLYLNNVTNGQILNNQMYNNYFGIEFVNVNDTIVSDNNVTNNNFYGIYLYNSYSNNFIQNNVSDNVDRGFRLQDYSLFNNIEGNLIKDNGNDGILLEGNCNNNTISRNIITNNGDVIPEYGIDFSGPNLYNTITGNIITDHTIGGIHFFPDSNNNSLYENILKNNTIHALDQGSNNDWNNTLIGNYWDNYSGYDMDLDGIGDTPYDVLPAGGSQDYLPIWNIQRPIAIDDLPGSLNNWTWAANQAWSSGSGTELDPYIIEDLNIDGNNTDYCISISNSEAYFIIQGNTLNNTINTLTEGGIILFNVSNGNIIGNNFYNNRNAAIFGTLTNHTIVSGNTLNNNRHGIYIDGSYNEFLVNKIYGDATGTGIVIQGSYNDNIINGNIIENCWQGIWIAIADNNTLSGNIVSNNMQNGIILLSNSDSNFLSENIVVNNTLSGILMLTSNNNTIESSIVHDNMQIGINLQSSDNNTIYDNVISENINTGVWFYGGSDGNLLYRNFFSGNGRHAFDEGSNNDWNSTTIGNYWDNHTSPDLNPIDGIVDWPYNISGSAGSKDYLPIAEDGPPSITINSPSDNDIFGTSAPSFSVTITDTFLDIKWYTLDGGLNNYSFTGLTGFIDQSAWDAMPDGMIALKFYASDKPGNIGSAEVNIMKDAQSPIIVINSPITDEIFGATAPIFIVEISDENLDSMWYSLDDGLTNFTFTTNSTVNQVVWSTISEGSITITFYANDTAGNLESESVNVEKSLLPPGDNFIIIIIILISIVSGVAIVTVVLIVVLRKRKPGEAV